MTRSRSEILLPVITVAVMTAIWETLSRGRVLPPEFPAATAVGGWIVDNIVTAPLWEAIGRTLLHWAAGLAIGIAVGAVTGAVMAAVPAVNELLSGVVEFFRPIPVVVYLPIMLLLLGARPQVAVILAAVAAVWPVLLQTFYGMKAIDPVAADTARSYGLSGRQRLMWITAPSVLPYFATGVRIASTITLLAAFAVELIGAVPGLGNTLNGYAANGVYDAIYGVIVITGLIGLGLNLVFERLERRLLRWHASFRPQNV